MKENRLLYGTGDLGLEYDVMSFNFADVLILRYLLGLADEYQTEADFNLVNEISNMNWSFKSQIRKFIRRFLESPYKVEDRQWIEKLAVDNNIDIIAKIKALGKLL